MIGAGVSLSTVDVAKHHVGARAAQRQYSQNLLFVAHVAVILFLCALILYPTLILLDQSVRDDGGNFSLAWYVQAYTSLRNYQAILNTLLISFGAAGCAVVAGTFLAWAVVRTDMPGRRVVELASIVPFISTPLIGALAWILLASPQTGLINQVWRLLGGGAFLDIYSIWGIIFVEVLYETPLVFLLVAGALRSMAPTLEEASLASGAGLFSTTLRVTLPLALPAILAGALLVFILAAEQFAVPAVLGTPAKIRVLTTSIFEAQSVYPARHGLAAALSVTLLAIALGGLWLHQRLLGERSFATVSGKSAEPRRLALGALRRPVLGLCLVYLLLAVVLPFTAIFLSSIRTIWTADFRWEQFTLGNYHTVLFAYPGAQRAIVNSLFIAVTGATATILLCAFISFLTVRARLPGSKLLDALAMVPMGFPGIVLAVGLLHAWISPPLVLYGTIWILFIAYMTRYIPIGVRAVSASLAQIHPELEESSLASGASWFQTLRHVTLPLLKPGMFAGWALLFVAFTRELSASILLYSPRLEVLSVVVYDMYQEGNFRALSALATVQVLIAIGVLALAKLFTRLDHSAEAQALR
jgi:iron(III) transport system permease protein